METNIGDSIDFESLSDSEVLQLQKIEIGGGVDYIIPIEIAAKLKQVSDTAIYDAIKKGKLRFAKGILLSSLKEYKVDKAKKLSGILGAIAKKNEED